MKNVLLICTDQQRFDTIAQTGNPIIKTPSMDRLVNEGVAFTSAYSPCPVCIPARFAMKTGLLPHQSDCVVNERMPFGYKSIMQVFSENGYQTHGVGKMHFHFPDEPRFDNLWGFDSRDISDGAADGDYRKYLDEHGFEYVRNPNGLVGEYYYLPGQNPLPQEYTHNSWVAKKTIDFLERRDKDKPFFVMSGYVNPHPPFNAPYPWHSLYRSTELPLPKQSRDNESVKNYYNYLQNRYKFRDNGIDVNLVRAIKAMYYGMISHIDYTMGLIFDYMDKNDMWKDTMVIFTSDHGEMLGDYDCFGKRCFLDSSARIPMIVYDPDVGHISACDSPVSLVDIFPTLIKNVGIDYDVSDLEGEDLISTAKGESKREFITGQIGRENTGTYMMKTKRYKYIYSAAENKEILFDAVMDPDELQNLAYNPSYRAVTSRMREALCEYLKNDGYDLPLEQDAKRFKKYPRVEIPEDKDAWLLMTHQVPQIKGYEREVEPSVIDIGSKF